MAPTATIAAALSQARRAPAEAASKGHEAQRRAGHDLHEQPDDVANEDFRHGGSCGSVGESGVMSRCGRNVRERGMGRWPAYVLYSMRFGRGP